MESVWDAYRTGQNTVLAPQAAQMQQATSLAALMQHVRQENETRQMRSELANVAPGDHAAALGVVSRYAKPESILSAFQGEANRKAQIDATKQLREQQLQATADNLAQSLSVKIMGLQKLGATKEQMQAEVERHNKQMEALKAHALNQYGIKLFDETGDPLARAPAPVAAAPSAVAPARVAPTMTVADIMRMPEADRAAAIAGLQNPPPPVQPPAGGMQPVAMQTPAPQASPAPVGPQVPAAQPSAAPYVPGPTGNEDMNDYRMRLAAAHGGSAPVSAPATGPIPTAAVVGQPPLSQMPGADKLTPPASSGPMQYPPQVQQMLDNAQGNKAKRKIIDQYNSTVIKGSLAQTKAPDSVVDLIARGDMAMPTGFALRSPYWQDVIERVTAKDPNFKGATYQTKAAAMRTFASGPEARNVTALNTVIGHLGTLDEMATALDNKDLRVANTVINRLGLEMGKPEIVNFGTARLAVADETMRVFRQVGASEPEAQRWADLISSSSSPAQLRGNISTLGKLLDSRVTALSQQYERTANQRGNPATVDPGNRAALDRLIGGKSAGGIPETNSKGWTLHTDAKGNKAYVSPDGKQ